MTALKLPPRTDPVIRTGFVRARDFELEGRVHAERNRKALRDMEAMIVEVERG